MAGGRPRVFTDAERAERKRVSSREHYRARRLLRGEPLRVFVCQRCGETGHQAKTCAMPREVADRLKAEGKIVIPSRRERRNA